MFQKIIKIELLKTKKKLVENVSIELKNKNISMFTYYINNKTRF